MDDRPCVSSPPRRVLSAALMLVSVLLFLVQLTESSTSSSTTISMQKPAWMQMDPVTLEKYKELAKQRHESAVKAAQESYYYSHSASNNDNNNNNSASLQEEPLPPPNLPPCKTFGIAARPTWSLPDFQNDFNLHQVIKVTQSPLFSQEECRQVMEHAHKHFGDNITAWPTLPSGRYHVAGFWIKSVPAIHAWFQEALRTKLVPLLAREFPQFCTAHDLVVDNAYLFQYNTNTGRKTDVHTDSGCLSFTIALNAPTEYSGGGTWFESLEDNENNNGVIDMAQGVVTVRPGGVRHCGQAVTSGTRYIIGGFCMHRHKLEPVRMLLGLAAERGCQGDYEGAEEAYIACLLLNSQFDAAYANLANILESQGKMEQALEALEYCHTSVNPRNAQVAYSLGILYLQKKEYTKCKECMGTCLYSDDCDVEAMLTMAQACRELQDVNGEESWYRRAIQTPGVSNEQAASAYLNLGLLKEGTDEEITLYQKGLELSPNHYQLRYTLASVLALHKKFQQAARHFRLAAETSTGQERNDALQSLYRSATFAVQKDDSADRPTTREKMMERLQEIMGHENYQALAASAAKRQ
jgi:tetratricopeptide (TPR) repeat protein